MSRTAIELPDGSFATEYEAATALVLEARRRKLSYGMLVANTTEWERNEIVKDYCVEKHRRGKQVKHGD